MSEARITDIAAVEGRLTPFEWDWAKREERWIDARWAELLAKTPAMFDGEVLLAHRWGLEQGCLRVEYFQTRFSRFLCWREAGRPGGLMNCFAMAALRSADGAFLLGEMGGHTANAGKIYFPAGTPDPGDLVGDHVDLAGSALRELAEETGLAVDDVEVEPRWTLCETAGSLACFRPMRLRVHAQEAVATIHAALDKQKDRELARMHVVRRRADIDEARMPPFLVAYLRRELAE
jgi:8-oxo-dGTP pyrophosphatase MutT (NUDIX family)